MSSPICLTARLGSHVHICAPCFWKKDCKHTPPGRALDNSIWLSCYIPPTPPPTSSWRLVMSHRWVSHMRVVVWTASIYTVVTNMLPVFLIPFGSKSIQFIRSLSTSPQHERIAFMFLGCFLETFSYCVKGMGVWQQDHGQNRRMFLQKAVTVLHFAWKINSVGDFYAWLLAQVLQLHRETSSLDVTLAMSSVKLWPTFNVKK